MFVFSESNPLAIKHKGMPVDNSHSNPLKTPDSGLQVSEPGAKTAKEHI